ncbi:MAG TPA: AAA-like domain-containing protein, partial [Fimbriimonas sp.]
EQWYDGLLNLVGKQLDLEDEVEDFWLAHQRLSPLQRWIRAVREVALPRCDMLVLFVDEIDAVRSLPFSTDEFFAAIRECYNLRSEDPDLRRLAFCLLGVATPSDLIRDVRTTPFNIGRRIDLHDFAPEEAAPLAQGLGDGDRGEDLLARILFWTGGHPYLTQRLCQTVAQSGQVDPRSVDALCSRIYLQSGARERDDNLLFVRDRLLRSRLNVAALLGLYANVRAGRRVRDDPVEPLLGVLKLSGIVKVEDGLLVVRNRIYRRAFDRAWIESNLPDADLKRERAAYRKGILRTVFVFGFILVIAGLVAAVIGGQRKQHALSDAATKAGRQARAAEASLNKTLASLRHERDHVLNETRKAKQAAETARQARRLADAKTREATANLAKAREAVRRETDALVESRRSLWESYLARAEASRWSGLPGRRFLGLEALGKAAAIRPDRKLRDQAITLMALADVRLEPREHKGFVRRNGYRIPPTFDERLEQYVQNDDRGNVVVRRVEDDRFVLRLPGFGVNAGHTFFSPDRTRLAVGYYGPNTTQESGHRMRLWDARTRQVLLELSGMQPHSAAFSPNGKILAALRYKGPVELYDAATGRQLRQFGGATYQARLVFDPTGTRIAVTGAPRVAIHEVATGRLEAEIVFPSVVRDVDWSPHGSMLAAACADRKVYLWDTVQRRMSAELEGHESVVTDLEFSPSGRLLASFGWDGTTILWNPYAKRRVVRMKSGLPPVFSADGRLLSGLLDESSFRLWEVNEAPECRVIDAGRMAESASFSPDGGLLALAVNRSVQLWDARRHHESPRLLALSAAAVGFGPDASLLVGGSEGLWFGRTDCGSSGLRRLENLRNVDRCVLSADGRTAAAISLDGIDVLRIDSPHRPVHIRGRFIHHWLAISPDGRWVAAEEPGTNGLGVAVWNAMTGAQVCSLPPHNAEVAFSPDGRWLVTGSPIEYRFWRVGTWQAGKRIVRAAGTNRAGLISFSRDGKLMAVTYDQNRVLLIDSASGSSLATFEIPFPSDISGLFLSPDGASLLVGSEVNFFWDVRRIRARLRELGLDWKDR